MNDVLKLSSPAQAVRTEEQAFEQFKAPAPTQETDVMAELEDSYRKSKQSEDFNSADITPKKDDDDPMSFFEELVNG